MQNAIIDAIKKRQEKKRPLVHVGDWVTVFSRLKEGDKERIQPFKGLVISVSPKTCRGPGAKFTVRKISEGVGVERIYPLHSPFVEKIQVESSSTVRRARLYYLRDLKGKRSRLKEKDAFAELVVPELEEPQDLVTSIEAAAPEEAANAEAQPKAQSTAEVSEKADKKAD